MSEVYFIGIGPGDPQLLTLKALKILKRAKCVIYPGSLISSEMLNYLKRINKKANFFDAFGKNLEEILRVIMDNLSQGNIVARLVSGDPSLYSSIMEHIEVLRDNGISYQIIPGISSAFLAASRLGIEFTYPELSNTLILTRLKGKTGGADEEEILRFAQSRSTLVFFLSSGLAEDLANTLMKVLPKTTPVAILYRLSHPEEKVLFCSLENLAQTMEREKIKKTALIVVGEILKITDKNYYKRSYLYGKH